MSKQLDLTTLRFFATAEHPCSYLDDQQATTIFVDPNAQIDAAVYESLAQVGFRRSGEHFYRPHCRHCKACIPIRVPVKEFKPSRSQKRCLKRNSDLLVEEMDSIDTDEFFELYQRYIAVRHSDGDMHPASRKQLREFLSRQAGVTRYFAFRNRDNKLLMVSVVDEIASGLSANYSFFEPEEPSRSLGVFNVLSLIQFAKDQQLPFVYLGYWIKDSRKMTYKTDYRPFQLFLDNRWCQIDAF